MFSSIAWLKEWHIELILHPLLHTIQGSNTEATETVAHNADKFLPCHYVGIYQYEIPKLYRGSWDFIVVGFNGKGLIFILVCLFH